MHCLYSDSKINSCSKSYLYFAFVYQNFFSTSTLLLSELLQSLDLWVLITDALSYIRNNLFWQNECFISRSLSYRKLSHELGVGHSPVIPATLEVETGGSQVQVSLGYFSDNLSQRVRQEVPGHSAVVESFQGS